jgi:hypothetical protein
VSPTGNEKAEWDNELQDEHTQGPQFHQKGRELVEIERGPEWERLGLKVMAESGEISPSGIATRKFDDTRKKQESK